MKMWSIMAVAVALAIGTVAQAELVMYDDFESYTVGESIHLQGTDDLGWGDPVERWHVQRNSSILGDHGWSTVETVDGDKCLQMINRDLGGELDTVYTSMSMSEVAINGLGTIYMRYKANGVTDTILATNDMAPGYDYELGSSAGGDGFQGTNNYSAQGAMVRLGGGDQPFHARNSGSYYDDLAIVQPTDTWMELWIHYDSIMKQAQYWTCINGGTPVQALNDVAPVEDWGNRNLDNLAVYNLKWFIGIQDWEVVMHVDTIAIDNTGWTLDRVDDPGQRLPGDANLDCTVDLDDFVILKTNFGTGTTWEEGDFNGDGKVDLDDFVILKTNFGTSCPE